MNEEVDVRIENHGSIFMFQLLSEEAREWVAEFVASEDWQWFGDGLCVEPRMARDLVDGMIADGLTVE
jgi:hypothetical protein